MAHLVLGGIFVIREWSVLVLGRSCFGVQRSVKSIPTVALNRVLCPLNVKI